MGDMVKPSHVDRQTRLAIYQNAYLLRLAEALKINFPSVHAVLGDDDFGRMMLSYLSFQVPRLASIRWFGDHLSYFLANQSPYRELPVLSEIAAFEWALRHTVDAADSPRRTYEALAALAPDEWISLEISLHPSVSLLSFTWNAVLICQAFNDDAELPLPEPSSGHWMVFRAKDGSGVWRSLELAELEALSAIVGGVSFSDLCEALSLGLHKPDDGASLTAAFLSQWVSEGIIC